MTSSQSKRQKFIQKFRSQEDAAGRSSVVMELVHDLLPDSELEQHDRNALQEFLKSFSLEEGIEYTDFYAEIEEAIHYELFDYDKEEPYADVEDYFVDEDIEGFDALAEDENTIICPLCW